MKAPYALRTGPDLPPAAEVGRFAGGGRRRRRHRSRGTTRATAVHRPHLEGIGRAVGKTRHQHRGYVRGRPSGPACPCWHGGARRMAVLVAVVGSHIARRRRPDQPHVLVPYLGPEARGRAVKRHVRDVAAVNSSHPVADCVTERRHHPRFGRWHIGQHHGLTHMHRRRQRQRHHTAIERHRTRISKRHRGAPVHRHLERVRAWNRARVQRLREGEYQRRAVDAAGG